MPEFNDIVDRDLSAWRLRRRLVLLVLLAAFLVGPAVSLLAHQGLTGKAAFLFPATLAFSVIFARILLAADPARLSARERVLLLALFVVLGGSLFAVGQMNWLTALAIASSAFGNLLRDRPQLAALGIAGCSGLGLGIGLLLHFKSPDPLVAAAIAALAGWLSYSAAKRNSLVLTLHETRAELARMAVGEERLRIARDLHDLLGHSLSLIALKAELAGRVIGPDPARAAKEIAELETVARRSLTEVRQAVTSYRQPTLATELAAARRMLASAGVDCRVHAPAGYSLPPEVDALLAWTVREGATNIVRHSGAMRVEIMIKISATSASAELSDNGARPPGGPAGTSSAGPRAAGSGSAAVPATGSGLAGLAERAARLGGTLSAGATKRGGFRLLVTVPQIADRAQPGAAATSADTPSAGHTVTGHTGTPSAGPPGSPAPRQSAPPDVTPPRPAAPGQAPSAGQPESTAFGQPAPPSAAAPGHPPAGQPAPQEPAGLADGGSEERVRR